MSCLQQLSVVQLFLFLYVHDTYSNTKHPIFISQHLFKESMNIHHENKNPCIIDTKRNNTILEKLKQIELYIKNANKICPSL